MYGGVSDAQDVKGQTNMRMAQAKLRPKTYYEQTNVGHAKYVVNFTYGDTAHADGSPFYDVRIFRSRQARDAFIRGLIRQGFTHHTVIDDK